MSEPDGKVLTLFASEADLDAAWAEFDEAMRELHRVYADEEPDEEIRRAAANRAVAAEAAFRLTVRRADRATEARIRRAS